MTMPNKRTLGNGAVALAFRVGRLSRAAPECERYSYAYERSVLI
jgi:hypothetical protein